MLDMFLISNVVLDYEGLSNLLGERKWKILKGRMVVARAQKMRSLYVMQAKVCQEETYMVDGDSSELWHKRFAHMRSKGMEILSKKNFLPDVAGMNLKPCVACLAEKQHRVSFHTRRRPSRRKNTIHLVHIDVCSMCWGRGRQCGSASNILMMKNLRKRKIGTMSLCLFQYQQLLLQPTFTKGYKVTLYSD